MPEPSKNCVVTGGSNGIGLATCRGLLQAGARVLLTSSSVDSGTRAVEQLRSDVPGADVHYASADLRSLRDTARLADQIQQHFNAIDVLILNAGIACPAHELTVDGIEVTFAVNHLSGFLLMQRLLPNLQRSDQARIVIVASQIHADGFAQAFESVATGYQGERVYCETKLANLLTTYELARRLQGTKITANALHPGVVATNLLERLSTAKALQEQTQGQRPPPGTLAQGVRRLYRRVRRAVQPARPAKTLDSPASASATSLFLALDPALDGISGHYFKDCIAQQSKPASYDNALAARLWAYSEQLIASRAGNAKVSF